MAGKTPSFKNLKASSRSSSWAKCNNRGSDTIHEMLLRAELLRMGLRYRKNVRSLPGKPDVVFFKTRVAVFCDGDFWHGRNWGELKERLASRANADYWIAKIYANIERDRRVNAQLEDLGWLVIRVWETDIHENHLKIASEIAGIIRSRTLYNKHTVLDKKMGTIL